MNKTWRANQPGIHIAIAIPRSKSQEAVRQMNVAASGLKLKVNIVGQQPDPNYPGMDYFDIIVTATYLCKDPFQRATADKALLTFQSLLETAVFKANNSVNKMKTRSQM